MLKNIDKFIKFDFENFFKGKELQFLEVEPWYEFNEDPEAEKKVLGSKILVNIFKDKTDYPLLKDGSKPKTNIRQNIYVKTSMPVSYFEDWEEGENIFVDIKKCTPYQSKGSKIKNELSIEGVVYSLDYKNHNVNREGKTLSLEHIKDKYEKMFGLADERHEHQA